MQTPGRLISSQGEAASKLITCYTPHTEAISEALSNPNVCYGVGRAFVDCCRWIPPCALRDLVDGGSQRAVSREIQNIKAMVVHEHVAEFRVEI